MIELRYLRKIIFTGTYRDGLPEASWAPPVLQYRTATQTSHLSMDTVVTELEWSDWKDVPTVKEEQSK